jgi:hypothetical protein
MENSASIFALKMEAAWYPTTESQTRRTWLESTIICFPAHIGLRNHSPRSVCSYVKRHLINHKRFYFRFWIGTSIKICKQCCIIRLPKTVGFHVKSIKYELNVLIINNLKKYWNKSSIAMWLSERLGLVGLRVLTLTDDFPPHKTQTHYHK